MAPAAKMADPARFCEFFFTGAAVLPGFLAYAEEPALAILAFTLLIISGAVAGIGDPQAPHRVGAAVLPTDREKSARRR